MERSETLILGILGNLDILGISHSGTLVENMSDMVILMKLL